MSDLKAKIAAARVLQKELSVPLKIEENLKERARLEKEMERGDFWSNQETAQKTVQAMKSIRGTLDLFAGITKRLDDAEVLLELAESENDAATLAECDKEIGLAEKDVEKLKLQALFTGEKDSSPAYIHFQAGMGGLDACDWVRMVVRMVSRYGESKGFKVEPVELDHEPEAGFKSATVSFEGPGAYGWLRGLQGTMRLVRISPFDAQSRRQTAFCAVEVLPEAEDEGEIEIKDTDLEWETFASGGPGGQHVNKTQSGVRVRHIPSGEVVACTEQRNQGANKKRALKVLASKLATLAQRKRAAEASAGYQSKSNMGFGAGDRHISVTLQPFTLVKDRRTGWETTDTSAFLDGDLDSLNESYLKWAASGGKPVAAED